MQQFKKDQQIPLVQVTDPNTGQVYYAPQNVVYDDKNNNGPQYLRNVIVDQAVSSSYFSGSVQNAVSASYALTASYALNGGGGSVDTGSFFISASFSDPNLAFKKGDNSTLNVNLSSLTVTNALTASYINGGTF